MRLPYELYLALRYLRFHRGRTFLSLITLISVAGVAVGTAALVIALSLNAGFVQDVRERIHSGSAHLTVLNDEEHDLFRGAEEVVARIEGVPGVAAAAPVIYSPALVTFEELGSHGFAELHGVPPADHSRVILGADATDNPFGALSRPTASGLPGIVLGEALAGKLGAFRGDKVRVLVPELNLSPFGAVPRNRAFEVVGTYRSDHFTEDSVRAYAELETARSLQRARGASSWVEVRLDDLGRLEAMKLTLRQALPAKWRVIDLLEQNQDLLRALRTEKLMLSLAIGLIVMVAALNIVSTLILMVNDKLKEIGTLTALGARPGGIARTFMLQGLVIGSIGAALGVTLGWASCWWLDRYEVLRVDPEIYYLTHIPFAPQPFDLIVVGIAAILVSFVATLYPAVRAARLDPVEALRYE